MFRILSAAIECLSSAIFIIPAIIILQYAIFGQHNFKKFVAVLVFAFYLMAVFVVTGIPTAYTLRADLGFNVIPFIDIVNNPAGYIINTILNIILFMPMGFMLPVIWKEYHPAKKTVLMGLAVSVIIEVVQIFSFRLTDIDDLITNTTGTLAGYYIGKILSFRLPWDISCDGRNVSEKYEPVIILIVIFLIGFFLKPLVSNAVWDIVLSSQLW